MNETLQCKTCNKEYNETDLLPRIILSCGHTLCSTCLKEIINKSLNSDKIICPMDRKPCYQRIIDETSFPVKQALLEVIISKKKTTMCMLHNKPHEFYCPDDSTKFCSGCGISSHRGHELVSLQEIELNIQRMQELFGEQLSEAVRKFENEANNLVASKIEEIEAKTEKEFNKCARIMGKDKNELFEEIIGVCNQQVDENGLFKNIEEWKRILRERLEDLKNGNYNEDILLQDINRIDVDGGIEKLQALENELVKNRKTCKSPGKEQEPREEVKLEEDNNPPVNQSVNFNKSNLDLAVQREMQEYANNKENFYIVRNEISQTLFKFSTHVHKEQEKPEKVIRSALRDSNYVEEEQKIHNSCQAGHKANQSPKKESWANKEQEGEHQTKLERVLDDLDQNDLDKRAERSMDAKQLVNFPASIIINSLNLTAIERDQSHAGIDEDEKDFLELFPQKSIPK